MRIDADAMIERCERIAGRAMLLTLIAAPMLWVLGYSLAYSLGAIGLLSEGVTPGHWQTALSVGGLRESLVFSVTIATIVTTLAACGSLCFTLAAPQARHSPRMLALICVPFATPSAVSALMTYQMVNPGGFLARLAFHAGLIRSPSQFPALVNDPYAVGILVTQTFSALPLLTLFFLNTWTTARADRYCQLAEALGATPFQARRRVALPLLLRRGGPLILLIFLWNLGSYEVPLLLGRQSPQMFSVLTQRKFGQFNLLERPQAFALATTYLLLVAAGVQLFLLWRRRCAQ